MDAKDLKKLTDQIGREITRGFGIEGPLKPQVRKLGRRLPKAQRRAAKTVLEAQRLMTHPKLSRRVDAQAVAAAGSVLLTFLRAVDPTDRRKGAVLSVLGSISLGLIALFVLVVVILQWRGFV